jgi:hypothetical protein
LNGKSQNRPTRSSIGPRIGIGHSPRKLDGPRRRTSLLRQQPSYKHCPNLKFTLQSSPTNLVVRLWRSQRRSIIGYFHCRRWMTSYRLQLLCIPHGHTAKLFPVIPVPNYTWSFLGDSSHKILRDRGMARFIRHRLKFHSASHCSHIPAIGHSNELGIISLVPEKDGGPSLRGGQPKSYLSISWAHSAATTHFRVEKRLQQYAGSYCSHLR